MRRLQNGAERLGGVAGWAWGQVMALGLTKRTRDLTRLHRALQAHPPGAPREDDLGRTVARVRQLMGERVT
jgi:hypothetical protein